MLRTLSDAEIETDAPLEVVVWTNEEGTRFSPAMIGSGVWAGVFDLGYGATSNPASIVYRQLIATNGVNLYQIHRFEVVGFRDVFSLVTIQAWRLSSGSYGPL